MEYQSGNNKAMQNVWFRKGQLMDMFAVLEKIQEEINANM